MNIIKIGNMSSSTVAVKIEDACHSNVLPSQAIVTYITSSHEIRIKIFDAVYVTEPICNVCKLEDYDGINNQEL